MCISIIFRSISVQFLVIVGNFSYIYICSSIQSNSGIMKIYPYDWFRNNLCVVLKSSICAIYKARVNAW